MGFSLELVLSPEAHCVEFTCAICCQLVEYPMHTSCSHVFCQDCIR
jgi:hypothetical protein